MIGYPPVSHHLPAQARDMLVNATKAKDPLERRIAIENAIDKVRRLFPSYFKPVTEESEYFQ